MVIVLKFRILSKLVLIFDQIFPNFGQQLALSSFESFVQADCLFFFNFKDVRKLLLEQLLVYRFVFFNFLFVLCVLNTFITKSLD